MNIIQEAIEAAATQDLCGNHNSADLLRRLVNALSHRDVTKFDRADWYWRTMDPDDSGDTPEDAIMRSMVGDFCVCEIASSYRGPTRYGFIAPVADPESDDTEFVHFATQDEAIAAANERLGAHAKRREAGE